jgi:GNAT superfamily N-acetyltransferase
VLRTRWSSEYLAASETRILGSSIKVEVRIASSADAQALKDLDTVVPVDSTRAKHIDGWLADDQVLVAEVDGQVVGYGVFNHAFFRQGQADMLMIHADYRGQGIGERLLVALEGLCDTPKFWVTTNLSNHRMQQLVTKRGFKACGYIDELDPGDPEIVYVKHVSSRGKRHVKDET